MFRSVMPSWFAIRYTNTPRYGATITKMIQSTFENPEVSLRRKMSANTVIRIQNQMMNAKNTNIVHMTSRNG